MKYTKITWSPYATNILDAELYNLCTPSGEPVDFHRDNCGRDFVLIVNDKRLVTNDNLQMSYWMNSLEIGGTLK